MLGNAFMLAFRQILRNPLRSLLTVLGIVIGVAAVITMVTIGNGATQAVKEQIESFGSNQLMLRKGQRMGPGGAAGAPSFKMEDVEALEDQIGGVVSAAPQSTRSTIVVAKGKNWTTSIIGSTNDYFTTDNRTLAEGRFFEPAEEMSGAAVCVIGATVQKELYGAGYPVVGEMLRVNAFSCRIVGLLAEKGTGAMGNDQDDLVVIPFNTASRRLIGNNRVNNILIAIDPQSDREHLKSQVREPVSVFGRRRQLQYSRHGRSGREGRLDHADHDGAARGRGCGESSGGRHRDHEHHARVGDRAHPRNRRASCNRRNGPGSAYAVSHRSRGSGLHGRRDRYSDCDGRVVRDHAAYGRALCV